MDKSCRENQNTHFMSNNFFQKNHAVYEIMWKNVGEPEATIDATKWRTRVVCWISNATRAHAHAHADAPGHPHSRTHPNI